MSSENAFPETASTLKDSSADFPSLNDGGVGLPDLESRTHNSVKQAIHSAMLKVDAEKIQNSRGLISDHAHQEESLNPQLLKGFEQISRLGRGGQGVVFRAIEIALGRTVAIKVLRDGLLSSEAQRRRFLLEVELTGRINHPNIVRLYGAQTQGEYLYCIMEYIEGIPLDLFVHEKNLSVTETLQLFIKICLAVQCAHEHEVIHRDLKPSNIFVDYEGEPHILDFGLAKDTQPRESDPQYASLSVTGQVLGTLPYNCPEQVSGRNSEIDHRSDQYSLAVVLYRILSGVMPYPVDGAPEQVRESILQRDPSSLRSALRRHSVGRISNKISAEDLENVIFKALSKEKDRRYPSMRLLADDLQRCLENRPVIAKPNSKAYLMKRFVQRHRRGVAVSSLVAMLLLGAGITSFVISMRATQISRSAQAGLLASSLSKLAATSRDARKTDEAIILLQQAVQLMATFRSDDPAILRAEFEANSGLVSSLTAQGELDRADPYLERASQIAAQMIARYPEDPSVKRMLASVLTRRGDVESARNEFAPALDHLRQAAEAYRSVVAAAPDNDDFQMEHARTLQLVAICLRELKLMDEALGCFTESHDIHHRMFEKHPNSAYWALGATRIDNSIATWHIWQKTPDDDIIAEDWLARIEVLLNTVAQRPAAVEIKVKLDEMKYALKTNKKILAGRAAARRVR